MNDMNDMESPESPGPNSEDQLSKLSDKSATAASQQSRACLATMPPEILVKIISELPTYQYLDIAHTSHCLRSILKTHASMICNLRIRARYQFEADFLKSEVASGWITPTHDVIKENQELCSHTISDEYHNGWAYSHKKFKHFSLLGEVKPIYRSIFETSDDLHIKVSNPGPQYLYFLEENHVNICDRARDGSAKEATRDGSKTSVKEKCQCAVHYIENDEINKNRGGLEMFGRPDGVHDFCMFLLTFNDLFIKFRSGMLVPRKSSHRFPRELIWYYGAEKLVLLEDAVSEDTDSEDVASEDTASIAESLEDTEPLDVAELEAGY